MNSQLITNFRQYHAGNGYQNNKTTEQAPSYKDALNEIKNGKKIGHWSWYIMPTNKGSRAHQNKFKLSNNQNLINYIHNKILRSHYIEFMETVYQQLTNGIDPEILLMSKVDVRKAYESAVLFKRVSTKIGDVDIEKSATQVVLELQP